MAMVIKYEGHKDKYEKNHGSYYLLPTHVLIIFYRKTFDVIEKIQKATKQM